MYQMIPHIEYKVWGGNRLKELKDLGSLEEGLPIGETWEISTHPYGLSKTQQGKGVADILGLAPANFPFLVKFIDTNENLSVQVHPTSEFAKKYSGAESKNECWLILEAQKGAGVYLGFRPESRLEDFSKAIRKGADASSFLNFIPVSKGDFFYVPAGCVHAIGAGVTLLEVQQNSNTTYRLWDWNRVDSNGDKRELHIDQGIETIKEKLPDFEKMKRVLFYQPLNQQSVSLVETDDFKVEVFYEKKDLSFKENEYASVISLDSKLNIYSSQGKSIELPSFSASLLTGAENYEIKADKGEAFVIVTS